MTEAVLISWRAITKSDKVRMFETVEMVGEYQFAKAHLEPIFDLHLRLNSQIELVDIPEKDLVLIGQIPHSPLPTLMAGSIATAEKDLRAVNRTNCRAGLYT